jgi:hypothetical protein
MQAQVMIFRYKTEGATLPSWSASREIEYEGAIYQVMNRGDRREPILIDEADRQRFVETLAEVCAKTGMAGSRLCPYCRIIFT